MNKEIIKEQLKECIQTILYNEEITINYKTVTKNNGVVLQGIMLCSKGDIIAPIIYIDGILEELEIDNSKENIESAAFEIIDVYNNSKRSRQDIMPTINADFIKQKVLTESYIDVVNKKDNLEILKGCPCTDYLDLAIVYRICVSSDVNGRATLLITNDLLESCGLTKEQLHSIALNNSKMENMSIQSMYDVLIGKAITVGMYMPSIEDVGLYVIVNTETENTNCLYTLNGIKELSKQLNSDLLILPSSRNEVLALAYDDTIEVAELREMVIDINKNTVDDEDVLSDNVYLYKRDKNCLEVVF